MLRTPSLGLAGALLALAGLVLLAVEAGRALGGQALGTVAVALLWAGLGLLVAGAVVVVASLLADREPVEP